MKVLRALPLLLALAGCQTVQTEFEAGTYPEIYFQRAQEALDSDDFDTALLIYGKFLSSDIKDPAYIASAEYEISFLHYKKGDYPVALAGFKALLAKYENKELAASLPAWPKALAQVMVKKLSPLVPAAAETAAPAAAQ